VKIPRDFKRQKTIKPDIEHAKWTITLSFVKIKAVYNILLSLPHPLIARGGKIINYCHKKISY